MMVVYSLLPNECHICPPQTADKNNPNVEGNAIPVMIDRYQIVASWVESPVPPSRQRPVPVNQKLIGGRFHRQQDNPEPIRRAGKWTRFRSFGPMCPQVSPRGKIRPPLDGNRALGVNPPPGMMS